MRKLSLLMILSLLLLQLVGLGNSYAQDDSLKVVATYSILGDVVQNVAGDAVELSVLVGADGDAHTFEPTPQDSITLLEANLIFENGIEFETWLDDLYESAGSEATRIAVSEGIEPHPFEEEGHDHAEEDHEHEEEAHVEIADLSPWSGEWNSAYRFAAEPVMEPVYAAIDEALPGMNVDEVKGFIAAMWQTDFEAFAVDGNTVTYQIGDTTVACEYTLNTVEEVTSGEFTFEVADFVAANAAAECEPFTHALFMLPHGEGAGMHYHIRYGNSDFATIMSDPDRATWYPSLYPATLTVDELAAGLMAAEHEIAAFIAESTGQEMVAEADEEHDHAEGEEHAHEHGEFDPHIWQNPQNVIVMTENVRDALIAADPANAETYTANAAAYITELQALDAEIEAAVSAIPEEERKLVTSHDALGYFADRYGFEVIATVLPATTEAADPSAGEMAELIETIQAAGVPAVFVENVSNPELLEQIADAAGVEVAPGLYTDALGEAGSEGDTYLKMMRYNARVIVEALQ